MEGLALNKRTADAPGTRAPTDRRDVAGNHAVRDRISIPAPISRSRLGKESGFSDPLVQVDQREADNWVGVAAWLRPSWMNMRRSCGATVFSNDVGNGLLGKVNLSRSEEGSGLGKSINPSVRASGG